LPLYKHFRGCAIDALGHLSIPQTKPTWQCSIQPSAFSAAAKAKTDSDQRLLAPAERVIALDGPEGDYILASFEQQGEPLPFTAEWGAAPPAPWR